MRPRRRLGPHGAFAGGSGHVPVPDFPIGKKGTVLPECASLSEAKKNGCYIRGLLAMVEKSGDPANELPRIDKEVRTQRRAIVAANCHILMHEVGRTWARRHGVTLETMFRYVPKSNDPGLLGGIRHGHGHAPGDEARPRSRAR